MSRAPLTWPKAMPASADAPASSSLPPDPARPTPSPASPTPTWIPPRWSLFPARFRRRSSATTPFRKRTSSASRAHAPSTISSSRTSTTSRASSRKRFISPAPAAPARSSLICRKDVQQAEHTFHLPDKVDLRGYKPTIRGNPRQIERAIEAIENSDSRCSTSAAACNGPALRQSCASWCADSVSLLPKL